MLNILEYTFMYVYVVDISAVILLFEKTKSIESCLKTNENLRIKNVPK